MQLLPFRNVSNSLYLFQWLSSDYHKLNSLLPPFNFQKSVFFIFLNVEMKSRTVEEESEGYDEIKISQETEETLKRWMSLYKLCLNHNFFFSHGININNQISNNTKKCRENEIFLMNKNKMFLVSSEKIVHDISGKNYLNIKTIHKIVCRYGPFWRELDTPN